MIPQKPAGAEEETVPGQEQTTAGLGEHRGLAAQLKITLCKAGTKAHGDHGLRKGTKQALGLYWDGEMWETAAEGSGIVLGWGDVRNSSRASSGSGIPGTAEGPAGTAPFLTLTALLCPWGDERRLSRQP